MTSLTVISTVVVALPPVFVAVTVYVVIADRTVGVPLISPVAESMVRPAGKDGLIAHETTVPPLDVGVAAFILVPFVRVNELGLYSTSEGIISFTSIVTVMLSLPPELVAVIV